MSAYPEGDGAYSPADKDDSYDADDAIQRMIGSARELKKVSSHSFLLFTFFLANTND